MNFRKAALLLCAMLPLQAAQVTISPGYISVGVGQTVQYSVTGASNVKWAVAGIAAGNSVSGTITSAGLYTAPAVVPANGPTVDVMDSTGKILAVVYVNVASAGPSISSISPNPIPVGSFTITLTGTNFQKGAVVSMNGNNNLSTTWVSATTLKAPGWQGTAGPATFYVENPGTLWGPGTIVSFVQGGPPAAQTIAPAAVSLNFGATQKFTSPNATSWTAAAGAVDATGLYTAPAAVPAVNPVKVTATGPGGVATALVTILNPNAPAPVISSVGANGQLPLGAFAATIAGSGFTNLSTAQLGAVALNISAFTPTALSVTGFAGTSGTVNLTVSNGAAVSLPFPVQVGTLGAQVSAAAARRFLEQAAFGPSPADAAHVQAIGFQAWLNEQFAMAPVSNYNSLAAQSQSDFSQLFLTNAVTNPDQLRQRVAFALGEIFVTSVNTLIWNQAVIPYQQMLMADSFGSFRQLLGDVTLNSAMGQYLNMANNAKADPVVGSVANENYAREVLQLFSIGTTLLNSDGSIQLDVNSRPAAAYSQFNITEFARAFTGWTYPPPPNTPVSWNAYISNTGPMVSYDPMHDSGAKTLLNGYVSPAGVSAQQDLNNALDNIFNHPNVGPFIGRQLIQHLVKSNPSPAYVSRVATAFADNGHGVRGDLSAVISAVLLDTEARANDNGGSDQAFDGHLQEPALYIAGVVRAFGGQITAQNYFPWDLLNMGQQLYNAPSVFNYYSPSYHVPGAGIVGGEFQIDTPDRAVYRANVISSLFGAWNNPVSTYGPGTTVDLTPFVALAAQPATLIAALDLTLTHGTMPAAMKQALVNAVTADLGGNVTRVQTAVYLILTSSYYNVWH